MNLDGQGWGIRDAAELVREIDRDLGERVASYPQLVNKGRLDRREADHRLGVIRDIREDLLFAFAPLAEGECRPCDIRPRAAVTWRAKIKWIQTELEGRRSRSEELIKKGRLDGNQAQRSISALEQLRRLYWENLFMWNPEPGTQASAYLEQLAALSPNATDQRRALSDGELGRAYRQTVREHIALLDQEKGEAQRELVA